MVFSVFVMNYFVNDKSVRYGVFLTALPNFQYQNEEKNLLSQRGAFLNLKFLENLALIGANSIGY